MQKKKFFFSISSEVESTDFLYTYKLDLASSNVDLSGKVFVQPYYEEAQVTCSVASPLKAEIQISNVRIGELPDLTQKDVSNLQISADGFFFNLQPIEGVSDLSMGGSFSILDHAPALKANAPDNYAFCTIDEDYSPFMREFQCDLKFKAVSKKMSLSNDGEKLTMTSECENGKVELKGDMAKVWGSVSDENSTEIANFVVDFEEPEFVVNVKPGECKTFLFSFKERFLIQCYPGELPKLYNNLTI